MIAAMLAISALPVVSADHREGLLEELDEDLLGIDEEIERTQERRERFLTLFGDDGGIFGEDRITGFDEDIVQLEEERERVTVAQTFIEGLDADLVHEADVDVLGAVEDLQDEIQDINEEIERLQDRRERLEERRDAIPADATERRERVQERIADVDEEIVELQERRDLVEARLQTFTTLDFQDDPERLSFAVDALDALPDVDRRIERLDERIERVEDRVEVLEERRAQLDGNETLRGMFLENRLDRLQVQLDALREDRDQLVQVRDALERLDPDAVDAELATEFGLDVGITVEDDARERADDELFADDDRDELFDGDAEDATQIETGAATATGLDQESDLDLDDTLNVLALG